MTVFLSNKHIYAQIINDAEGRTLVAAKDSDVIKDRTGGKTTVIAQKIGEEIATRALKAGIKQVVFDRGGRKYHGRVKALADSARQVGLEF